jgi:catechol 2,3-dioxygenase-like lactoylglutathione lyase family enzyme
MTFCDVLYNAGFVGFIPVTDLDQARDFYCEVLGLRLVEETPVAVVVDSSGVSLRLTKVPDLQPQTFTIAGWLVDDMAEMITFLAARAVPVKRYAGLRQDEQGMWTAPSGDRVAWFEDPDGNILSITCPIT